MAIKTKKERKKGSSIFILQNNGINNNRLWVFMSVGIILNWYDTHCLFKILNSMLILPEMAHPPQTSAFCFDSIISSSKL